MSSANNNGLLVVGSVAYDSVKTPEGSRQDALGGSAMYFSLSSSYFSPVSVVAVVGEDFRDRDINIFKAHNVDVSGLVKASGKTFRWSGVYSTEDVNQRETLDTQLNVFADFSPTLTEQQRKSPYVFLANIDPGLQLDVLEQMAARPKLVALDTMNFWIEGRRDALTKIVSKVDVLFMDEGEVRQFADEPNLVSAARKIIGIGPKVVVAKRGEHGVMVVQNGSLFVLPAFPLDRVVDPTGAGDTFAGGFMGYLASSGDLSPDGFRRAAMLGSVMGSFTVEAFSMERLHELKQADIESRFRNLSEICRASPLGKGESLPWRNGN
ncbi:MAG: PfkB family carbohydrate kinase [Chloroflexi bacterium]|nr:PfkB family carbohydrate kinase [Chloroflexota bacterium]